MSEERRERNQQRRPPSSGQNQRLFSSSIRSALGGQKPRNNGRRNNEAQREIRPSYQSIDEALKELSKALEQPSTSLDEFEAYVRQNADKFGEQECQEVATKLMGYALKSSEFRFLLRICSDCIRHLNLMDAVAQELLLAANEYFLNEDSEKQAVPELLGHIVASKWPPGKGKAIESVNPVLFVGMNLVLSWIGIMKSYGEPKSPTTTKSPVEEEKSIENEKAESQELESNATTSESGDKEEADEYDEKTVALVSLSICTVCNIAQRNFWLNFMETFDDVFMVTKQLLANPEARLPRKVKESLLQLYMSLFTWSATNKPKYTSISTQTQ